MIHFETENVFSGENSFADVLIACLSKCCDYKNDIQELSEKIIKNEDTSNDQ